MSKKIKSSGILYNLQANAIIRAFIEIVNLDDDDSRTVTVEVKNWNTCPPTEFPKVANQCGVLIPGTFTGPLIRTIPPNSRLEVTADIPANTYYEVRITFSNPDEDLLVNTFASQNLNLWLEGHTVLNKDFNIVELD